ncbi:MAG TPA: tripartite tricarboxylate transporter substrate-binding protein, partial [Alicycliphilus sp.]|nr:tripartite tricarboxylate transporter substrate-binding protein [Alicycliphilus sp.]
PTLKEAGYPLVMTTPFGIAGPAGLPDNIVKLLDSAISRALKDPKFVEAAGRYGIDITYMNQNTYTAYAKNAAVHEKDSVKTMLEGAVKN